MATKAIYQSALALWVWHRVHATDLEVVELGAPNFKSIEELQQLFASGVDPRQRIQLKDLFRHAKKVQL